MIEQFVVFDWKGYMAHFRQFDTNSSSLSYSFPPPTVIAGMLAGILGIERDSYYDRLDRANLKIGVQIKSPLRKIIQTVNYVFAKNPGDLNMSGDNLHTQIPVELVVSERFPRSGVHFRIFLHFTDDGLCQEVKDALRLPRLRYLPYLGSAGFTSWLEWPLQPQRVEEIAPGETAVVDTVVDLAALETGSLSLESIDGKPPTFIREHMRRDFKPGREPGDLLDVVWERNRGKIKAIFREPVFRFRVGDEELNVSFF